MTTTGERRAALALLLVLPASLTVIALDGAARRRARERQQPAVEALAAYLPSNDLALAGGARWLRSASLEEPGAAFQDGPALPDPDPAGAVMAPPREMWTEEALRRTRRERP
ncbi:MAG TPA: hypothetical protein VGI39_33990 [Polyangiaceae bacterium]|jgi:hypothetical protein